MKQIKTVKFSDINRIHISDLTVFVNEQGELLDWNGHKSTKKDVTKCAKVIKEVDEGYLTIDSEGKLSGNSCDSEYLSCLDAINASFLL